MCFLATPHRGADSAQTLSRILASSFFYGSKTFVEELVPNSPMLQVRRTAYKVLHLHAISIADCDIGHQRRFSPRERRFTALVFF
jgi:hypothetical protein